MYQLHCVIVSVYTRHGILSGLHTHTIYVSIAITDHINSSSAVMKAKNIIETLTVQDTKLLA